MHNEMMTSEIYLRCGTTDMRKSIDGLVAIVMYQMKLPAFSNACFVFCNRGRNKIKILKWEVNGFWLLYKRLEKGQFKWPQNQEDRMKIDVRQLRWMLDGLSIAQVRGFSKITPRKCL